MMKHWTVPAHLLEDKEKEKKSVRGRGTPTKKGEEEVLVVKDFKKLEKKHLCDIGNIIVSLLTVLTFSPPSQIVCGATMVNV